MCAASPNVQQAGRMVTLQAAISERQRELQKAADILARKAQNHIFTSRTLKTVLIVLGAVSASQGAFEKFLAPHEVLIGITFMVMGITIASVAGVEAAFKYEARAAELNMLAATCHSTVRLTDAMWHKNVGLQEEEEKRLQGAMSLIELQNAKLSEIQERAATLSVNLILAIRQSDDIGAMLWPERAPDRQPYAA